MNAADFNHALSEELDQSYVRLSDYETIDRYEVISRGNLEPLFDEVILGNFNLPRRSWEVVFLILHSTWFRLMLRRNELHNEALDACEGSAEVLAEFKRLIASEEAEIFRRLDALLGR